MSLFPLKVDGDRRQRHRATLLGHPLISTLADTEGPGSWKRDSKQLIQQHLAANRHQVFQLADGLARSPASIASFQAARRRWSWPTAEDEP